MPDRENVIKELAEIYDEAYDRWVHRPYIEDKLVTLIRDGIPDALAMLREQDKPDCEHAEHDGIGCLGYAGCTQDDEPIDACKTCREYTGNRCEEVNGDAD